MRKTTIVIACCIVALLLGYSGFRGYRVWKQNHWLAMAKSYAAKSDIRNEMISLQQALRLNPQNLEACRMMANLADAMRSPGALILRQRLVDLDPKSLANRLALAQTAMFFNDFTIASNALAGVDEADKQTAVYENVAGLLASGAGQRLAAQMHFAKAVKLDAGNLIPQLNLAALQLHSSNSLDIAAARIDLKRISLNATNFTIRSQAQRELVMDALRFDDTGTALAITKELAQSTNATFSDRLLRLEVLRKAKSPEFKPALAAYEREAAVNPVKLSNMAIWLIRTTSSTGALAWLQSLPIQTQTNQPAALLIAQCHLELHDWNGLQATLQNQNWNEAEFIRHAFLARALREQELRETATAEWSVALKFASDQKGTLISLFRLAADWGWNSEAEQILWIVVNRYPEEQWAPPALTQALMAGGRTRPLMQLFSVLSRRSPDDLEIKNNLAFTAMLLGADEISPYGLAQEVYAKDPKIPSYASTYAFSLYLQKKYPEALKVMQKLTAKDLENPSIAGYYGLVLKATGNSENAKSYLRLTANTKLLPEEKALFQQTLGN